MFRAIMPDGALSVFPAGMVSYLSVGSGCPPLAATTDPALALNFNGVPLCMDLGKRGMYTPYASGRCQNFFAGYNPTLIRKTGAAAGA
jgi:hypothetical protein